MSGVASMRAALRTGGREGGGSVRGWNGCRCRRPAPPAVEPSWFTACVVDGGGGSPAGAHLQHTAIHPSFSGSSRHGRHPEWGCPSVGAAWRMSTRGIAGETAPLWRVRARATYRGVVRGCQSRTHGALHTPHGSERLQRSHAAWFSATARGIASSPSATLRQVERWCLARQTHLIRRDDVTTWAALGLCRWPRASPYAAYVRGTLARGGGEAQCDGTVPSHSVALRGGSGKWPCCVRRVTHPANTLNATLSRCP
jgi:hypothetical protein